MGQIEMAEHATDHRERHPKRHGAPTAAGSAPGHQQALTKDPAVGSGMDETPTELILDN